MFNKPEFIGKEAILKIKEEGVTKRLAQFHLMNFDKVIEYHSNILISRNLFLSINFADFTNFFFKYSSQDKDLWPGGGEALYRNGEYVGAVSNSAYGFTLEKMICLGFIQHPDSFQGTPKILEVSIKL